MRQCQDAGENSGHEEKDRHQANSDLAGLAHL